MEMEVGGEPVCSDGLCDSTSFSSKEMGICCEGDLIECMSMAWHGMTSSPWFSTGGPHSPCTCKLCSGRMGNMSDDGLQPRVNGARQHPSPVTVSGHVTVSALYRFLQS